MLSDFERKFIRANQLALEQYERKRKKTSLIKISL